ncbi:natural killer cells antigen CD94-like [Trichechus manatus latirostris]|uniref:Natural killer cells antigen CD94-like n=1 Tax=Trichechus manatus latirostris TaxID=127582 RepID=A0A2Y9QEC6_TRIMA|nr:natural killer cells antigen CD94-like [Trichechus manatus latirostris]
MAAFQTTSWRLISGALGVVCLLLMATLGILLKRWYQCNCYFFSKEDKTWAESRDFCASQNSSLLQLESKDELVCTYVSTFSLFWKTSSLSKLNNLNQVLNQRVNVCCLHYRFFFQNLNPRKCVLYKPRNSILDEDCRDKNGFICKQRFI